ncbi:hypothetical protein [Novisyntrophococcus fermenticellae]|uniref:hypothetical protein n=1 Tax=Novisyntrophococcus fermenticellae TaxID=2068655 RepID=UPI001E5536CB|nr:hypothetical protein [Novisyntrophococcus fermenticellae]
MKGKKLLSVMLCLSLLTGTALGRGDIVRADTPAEENQVVGSVNMEGDYEFDSDSIKNEDENQWRWLGYPESRMAINYGKRDGKAKYDGGMNLNAALVVNGLQTKDALHKIQMGSAEGEVKDYTNLKTVWYPYKLTADAQYENGNLHMDEFFADKDTFIRYIQVENAKDTKMRMSASISGIHTLGSELLVEQKDYWLAYRFLQLDENGEVIGQYQPNVNGNNWSVDISFNDDSQQLAFAMTMLPKNVGENSEESTLSLAQKTTGEGKNIGEILSNTKGYWDEKLSRVPAPQKFGFDGNASNGTISEDKHRRAFYAAWAFQYQNIVEPTPEKGYNHYQVTLGIPSTWASGANSAPNSCSWESLFDIQEISYLEPEIAWDAMKGFIYSIDENGILDGECLPSQKAHTVWVCYLNMKKAFPERIEELNQEMEELYGYIYRYLMWRAENPRWIYGHENFENEKDISFVTQWFSDVNYAIKIANILGKFDDIAIYEKMKNDMAENSRKWFFSEYDLEKPDSKDNRIMAFAFLQEDGSLAYKWPGSSHNAKSDDALNYVYEALFIDLPKDMTDKLVHSYLAYIDGKAEDPLLGFQFYKYGDGCHTAYGLLEKELQYPELKGKWEEYIDAVLANAVKNVDFAECLRVNGNTTKLEGVEPSSFTASAIIDYTYMKNGLRIDMGNPVSLGGADLKKTDHTDIDVYTIKGIKPELPKTVPMDSRGQELETLVVWPEIPEENYAGVQTDLR